MKNQEKVIILQAVKNLTIGQYSYKTFTVAKHLPFKSHISI